MIIHCGNFITDQPLWTFPLGPYRTECNKITNATLSTLSGLLSNHRSQWNIAISFFIIFFLFVFVLHLCTGHKISLAFRFQVVLHNSLLTFPSEKYFKHDATVVYEWIENCAVHLHRNHVASSLNLILPAHIRCVCVCAASRCAQKFEYNCSMQISITIIDVFEH